MSASSSSRAARSAVELTLDESIAKTLRARLPTVAEETVAAVVIEVPGYAGALSGAMGDNIQKAVEMALGGFLKLATSAKSADPRTPLEPALDAAYALGRGEARSGRTMDALLAAYRVGARVAWRELSTSAVEAGLPATTLAQFAELVFAYIDELSASSVAGHSDEIATTGRVRQRYLEQLTRNLILGASAEVLAANAERADWVPPSTLTAVLLPTAHVRGVISALDARTLQAAEDVPGLDPAEESSVLLVPDMEGSRRRQLMGVLQKRHSVVGPARPWMQAQSSCRRALRAMSLGLGPSDAAPVDTESHLSDVILSADPEALGDLRARVLEPLASLRPATAERLAETLRSWLLHQGRRGDVAADLSVHAQTVRYRMGQLRELFGDRLNDPTSVLELTIALSGPTTPP